MEADKLYKTIKTTILIISLVIVFTIPIIVFSNFSPKLPSDRKLTMVTDTNVLGTSDSPAASGKESYKVELISNPAADIQIEEKIKSKNQYSFRTYLGPDIQINNKENILLIKNTGLLPQTIKITVLSPITASSFSDITLNFGEKGIFLGDLSKNLPIESSLEIGSTEDLIITIETTVELPTPLVFDLDLDFQN